MRKTDLAEIYSNMGSVAENLVRDYEMIRRPDEVSECKEEIGEAFLALVTE